MRRSKFTLEQLYMQCKFTLEQFIRLVLSLGLHVFFTKETLRGQEDPTPPTGE